MRIIFVGTVIFSKHLLEKLIDMGANIAGVVTKEKSSFNSDFTDLSSVARLHGLPYKYVADINEPENIKWIKNLKPDIIFCFGFSQILKKDILEIAPMGVVGFHPARLPENRGRHPLVWAIALGLKKTASTFFFMDERADSGDILSQKEVIIAQDDNAQTLYSKINIVAIRQLKDFLPRLLKGNYNRIPQDTSKATYWRKRNVADGQIDFRMGKRAINNLIRALTHPYVGAHLIYKGKLVKVWEAKVVNAGAKNDEYGKVLSSSGSGVLVKCYDGAVLLKKHDFSGLPKKGEYLL